MALKQQCAKYHYVVSPSGPKIAPVPDQESKDEESPADYNPGGYLPVKLDDNFKDGRYRVVRKLGWGHFSTVWLVKDSLENRHSALKVVKSASRYAETARDEIKLLSELSAANPKHPGRKHIVSFLDSFVHTPNCQQPLDKDNSTSHVCIVFEPLGENLLALIERHKKKGVPIGLVKTIARQMLLGLEYLHDECDLVHTDLKPENIMISIPDVEVHIGAELSSSLSPTSRTVGVPLSTRFRHTNHSRRERHVQIFDSQPLSSPRPGSSSFGSCGIATAAATATPSISSDPHEAPPTSPPSSESGSVSSLGSTTSTCTPASVSTPPTSFGSVSGKVFQMTPAFECNSGSAMTGLSSEPPTSPPSNASPDVVSKDVVLPTVERRSGDADLGPIQSDLEIALSTSIKEDLPHVPVSPCHVGPSLLTQTAPKRMSRSLLSSPPPTISKSPSCSSPTSLYLPPRLLPPVSIKIADLGNATPSTKHYTEDIQTRQYRAPEAILGRRDWGTRADVWSAACMVFELLTAEYLFDPQGQGELFTKDDDHMAQIIELLGDFPLDAKMGGRYSRELFDHTGALRYIRTLKPWPLKCVMMEKYLYSQPDADALCEFLEPMLAIDQRDRKDARDMAEHRWLDVRAGEDVGEW